MKHADPSKSCNHKDVGAQQMEVHVSEGKGGQERGGCKREGVERKEGIGRKWRGQGKRIKAKGRDGNEVN